MREAIIYNITEEGKIMTREQQEEVEKILAQEEGRVEGGDVVGCRSLYTTQIKRILEHGADMYYADGHLRISNWTPDLPPKPEPLQEIKFRAFKHGEYNIVLQVVKDPDCSMNHDHVELWCGDRKLGYMHINKEEIVWWGNDINCTGTIRIDKDC